MMGAVGWEGRGWAGFLARVEFFLGLAGRESSLGMSIGFLNEFFDGGKIATLELRPSDAEKLSLARRLGSISLILRSLAEKAEESGQNSSLDRQDSVTIVRFGQASSQIPPN